MVCYIVLVKDRNSSSHISFHSYLTCCSRAKGWRNCWPFVFIMARESSRQLYQSQAWKNTRRAYLKSRGGLCERCMAKGIITPAEIVHHKVPLTDDNVKDLNISLSWDNLQALCRVCHAEVHEDIYMNRSKRRYTVNKNGTVDIRPPCSAPWQP